PTEFSKIIFFDLGGFDAARQHQFDLGAAVRMGAIGDLDRQCLTYLEHEGNAETCAETFGSGAGAQASRLWRERHARPLIEDGDAEAARAAVAGDDQSATIGRRIDRVQYQIVESLLQQMFVRMNLVVGLVPVRQYEFYGFGPQSLLQWDQGAL